MRNSDSSSLPQVILLCGISGSGKTTYALDHQSQGYRRLSVDEMVWALHGEALITYPVERQTEIYVQANKELIICLERELAVTRPVVVDATLCSREKRDAMRRLCRSFGVEPQLIYMRASREVLVRRIAQRKGTGPNDQPVPIERLFRFCEGFEEPMPDENALVIDQN